MTGLFLPLDVNSSTILKLDIQYNHDGAVLRAGATNLQTLCKSCNASKRDGRR